MVNFILIIFKEIYWRRASETQHAESVVPYCAVFAGSKWVYWDRTKTQEEVNGHVDRSCFCNRITKASKYSTLKVNVI